MGLIKNSPVVRFQYFQSTQKTYKSHFSSTYLYKYLIGVLNSI